MYSVGPIFWLFGVDNSSSAIPAVTLAETPPLMLFLCSTSHTKYAVDELPGS